MSYEYNIACASHLLTLRDYQKWAVQLISSLAYEYPASVAYRFIIETHPFYDGPVTNIHSGLVPELQHAPETVAKIFADLFFLEDTIYTVLREYVTIAIKRNSHSFRDLEITLDDFAGLMNDLQHIHCQLTKLLFDHAEIPIWTISSNKVTIHRSNTSKVYEYSPECYTDFELKSMLMAFMKKCHFANDALKNSYFFQSQIVRIMAKPTGIQLIRKAIEHVDNGICNSKILIKKHGYWSTDRAQDTGNYTGDNYCGRLEKSQRGLSGQELGINLLLGSLNNKDPYIKFNKVSPQIPHGKTDVNDLKWSFSIPFLSTAHELRHVINAAKGKVTLNLLPSMPSHLQQQWRNPEELRTINVADYCENVIRADFGYPLRISHWSVGNFKKAAELSNPYNMAILGEYIANTYAAHTFAIRT